MKRLSGWHKGVHLLGVIALVAISLYLVSDRPAEPSESDPGEVWFVNLLEGKYTATEEEQEWMARYVLGDESAMKKLEADEQPRILFLSVGDGDSKARVYIGTGFGFLAALDDALEQIPSGMRSAATVYKVDLVKEAVVLQEPDFDENFVLERSLVGIAFDESSQAAFIPEELVANDLLSPQGKIYFDHIESYLTYLERPFSIDVLKTSPVFYYYNTEAFAFERSDPEAVEISPLYRGHKLFDELTSEMVLEAAVSAGDYLVSVVDGEGRFVYEYYPTLDESAEGYNIIRHAGTVYSMLELYEVSRDSEHLDAARRALDYLMGEAEPCFFDATALCVLSGDEEKLGANALTILSMAKYTEVSGDDAYLTSAQALANWILYAQAEDGHFDIQIQDNGTGLVDDFESEYYPGEAVFALVRLYALDGDERWLTAAETAANYLIQVRDDGVAGEDLIHDHWLLYGLNELYRYRPNEDFINHAIRITESILVLERTEGEPYRDWAGSYYTPPTSNSTATRTEGLLAAYKLFTDYGYTESADRVWVGIELGIRFQLQTQFDAVTSMYLPNPSYVRGGFKAGLNDPSVRIDTVQHNISGLLGVYSLL